VSGAAGDFVVHEEGGQLTMIVRTHGPLLHVRLVRIEEQKAWFARLDVNTVVSKPDLPSIVKHIRALLVPGASPAAAAAAAAVSPAVPAGRTGASFAPAGHAFADQMQQQQQLQQQRAGSPVAVLRVSSSQRGAVGVSSASPALARSSSSGPAGMQQSNVTKGLLLAKQWGLDQLPCFYASDRYDAMLKHNPTTYLIRVSNSQPDSLVIVCKGDENDVRRITFKSIGNNMWQSGVDKPFVGSFADFVRRLLPPTAVPLNDRLRMPGPQVAAEPDSLSGRLESHRSNTRAGRDAPFSSSALVLSKTGALPVQRRFNGRETSVYGSISDAMTFYENTSLNSEDVQNGTTWTGVALSEALASIERMHDDTDGTTMAAEKYYFYDIDSLGANAILSGREAGSFLVRLSSNLTQFVVCLVDDNRMPKHVLIQAVEGGLVAAGSSKVYPTLRKLIANMRVLTSPVSRVGIDPEFVNCEIVLERKPLGDGAGGVVLKGMLNGTVPVAVKRFNAAEGMYSSVADQLAEGEAMMKVPPHPNVNRLFGIVMQPLSLVVEFCNGGSLDRLLGIDGGGEGGGTVLSMPQCTELALQIARGVAHLHSARLVHRDLAARNILIERPLTPKVCDFGMSVLLQDDETQATSTPTKGPVKWQAPEQMRGKTREFGFKTDVFSFAVLLTEIINNQMPWKGLSNQQAAVEVVRGKRTPINERASPHLLSVINACWSQNAADRPMMPEVINMLADESLAPVYSGTKESIYDDV
jgi:serine/threonine protein kinase